MPATLSRIRRRDIHKNARTTGPLPDGAASGRQGLARRRSAGGQAHAQEAPQQPPGWPEWAFAGTATTRIIEMPDAIGRDQRNRASFELAKSNFGLRRLPAQEAP